MVLEEENVKGTLEVSTYEPVIHVGFGDIIHKILRSTCNECGRILLDDSEIETYTNKMNELKENGENLNGLIKEIYNVARKDECPHCGAEQAVK